MELLPLPSPLPKLLSNIILERSSDPVMLLNEIFEAIESLNALERGASSLFVATCC